MAEAGRLTAIEARGVAFLYVAESLDLSRAELVSPSRLARLVEGRALFVWVARSIGPKGLSFARIGRWLGGRDPSTIEHLFNAKVPQLRGFNADFELLCARFPERCAALLETYHGNTRH